MGIISSVILIILLAHRLLLTGDHNWQYWAAIGFTILWIILLIWAAWREFRSIRDSIQDDEVGEYEVAQDEIVLDTVPKIEFKSTITGGKIGRINSLRVVELSIDVAVPNKTILHQVFDLAILVRPPSLPALQEEHLDKTKTGEANVLWPEDQPYVSLRVEVRAPDCTINDADSRSFRLYRRRASPILYFHLVPQKLGVISMVVELYQEDDEIGSALVQTKAYKRRVGKVKVEIVAQSSSQDKHSDIGDEEIGFKQMLLREKQRRLQKLELQNARKGQDTEPEILNEIEDLQKEIEELKKQVFRLP